MEKLIKSVNSLKYFYGGLSDEEKLQKDALTPKERQNCCITITEVIMTNSIKSNVDFQGLFAVSMEILLLSCDDNSADVRLQADDSLNKLIKHFFNTHIGKILVDLYKEIKKNGAARSLKAALWRFSKLCSNIRSSKCRPYILNLLPSLCRISQREEEVIQECLGPAVEKIFFVLGVFANETEIQGLIASFLKNLSHPSATQRRTAGVCLFTILKHSKKPAVLLSSLMDSILDILNQRSDDRPTILGCLQSFRSLSLLLHCEYDLTNPDVDGVLLQKHEAILLKIFETSMYFLSNSDHTVVTSSLELLEQLLQNFSLKFSRTLCQSDLSPTTNDDKNSALRLPELRKEANLLLGDLCHVVSTNSTSKITDLTEKIAELSFNNIGGIRLQSQPPISFIPSHKTNNPVSLEDIDKLFITKIMRFLCQRFLLTSATESFLKDRKIKVSVKHLSMNCVSLLVNMYPQLLCVPLYRNQVVAGNMPMSRVLQYHEHEDPKLKGAALIVASRFLNSVLTKNRNGLEAWYNELKSDSDIHDIGKYPNASEIISMITSGLNDESLVTSKIACEAISICIGNLLNSKYVIIGLNAVRSVLSLQSSNYWLIKCTVLEILESLNYRQLQFLAYSASDTVAKTFQSDVMATLFQCLSDDDHRVRKSAAEAVAEFVGRSSAKNNLTEDKITAEAFKFGAEQVGLNLLETADLDRDPLTDNSIHAKSMLKTHRGFEVGVPASFVSESLAHIISEIVGRLSRAKSKQLYSGCLLTLRLLSEKYPVGDYPAAWGCHFTETQYSGDNSGVTSTTSELTKTTYVDVNDNGLQQQLGLLPIIMGCLQLSWLSLDTSTHCDTLLLAGNLLAGSAVVDFKKKAMDDIPIGGNKSSKTNPFSASYHDPIIASYAHQLFTHLMKLLSVSHHVISDTVPSSPGTKIALPTLSASSTLPNSIRSKEKSSEKSPGLPRKFLSSTMNIKASSSPKEDADKDNLKEKKSIGNFHNVRIYMKLYDQLVGSFKNYNGHLEFGSDDKFCAFVRCCLDVSCQMLEVAAFSDVSVYTEEILGFLKTIFLHEPTYTIQCVQQLLKALFGTNLIGQLESQDKTKVNKPLPSVAGQEFQQTLSHQVFRQPINQFTMAVANSSFHHSLESKTPSKENKGWFGSLKTKVDKQLNQVTKNSKNNKSSIQNYIRLFESLVIKSLKKYTTTSCVDFQKQVLNLLAQLVQLRVNYCMLDSDQVFINFILKQFESIEGGLIRGSETLIPHVFFFLVLLSYEKYHSKSVITMSKVIQLCDGLMASGQGLSTHVIPAMEPIVYDLFVVRATLKPDSEMKIQQEVVQSMILKLIKYSQVFEMLTTVLQYCREEATESWKSLSKQVVLNLFALLDQNKIEISSCDDIKKIHILVESLYTNSLRPIEYILQILFNVPQDLTSVHVMKRWLVKVVVLLRVVICQFNEQTIQENLTKFQFPISKLLSENRSKKVAPGQHMAIFFHEIVGIVAKHLSETVSNTFDASTTKTTDFLCSILNELLLGLTYMLRSGQFRNFSKELLNLMDSESQFDGDFTCHTLIEYFLTLSHTYPVVTLFWAQYLTHLGYWKLSPWEKLTKDENSTTVNKSIIKRGAIILMADCVLNFFEPNLTHSKRTQNDFVMCQNMNQFDLMEFLIDNFMLEMINLNEEPSIQDFISVVLSSKMGKKFLESISNYTNQLTIASSLSRKILKCLKEVPVCHTLSFLAILIGRNFLFSREIALSLLCDRRSCKAVELFLSKSINAEFDEESVDKFMGILEPVKNTFGRLHCLLSKLKPTSTSVEAPNQQQFDIDGILLPAEKEWFKKALLSQFSLENSRPESARSLRDCEYDDIINVMTNQNYHLSNLRNSIRLGISEVFDRKDYTSCVMSASCDVMLIHLQSKAHKIMQDSFESLANDQLWRKEVLTLCDCLVCYMEVHTHLTDQHRIESSHFEQVVKFIEHIFKLLSENSQKSQFSEIICALELLQQSLQIGEIKNLFGLNQEILMLIVQVLYSIIKQYIKEIPIGDPFLPQDIPEEEQLLLLNDPKHVLSACIRLSQLMFLTTQNESLNGIPILLKNVTKNIILHLCEMKLFNSFVRVPTIVWKYGWMPPRDDIHLFPDIPANYLQDKEVFREFIRIVNLIGWTDRTQFEETWATLLGVLVSQSSTEQQEQNEESMELSCLAIHGLTSLVINCSLEPISGQPSSNQYKVSHRGGEFNYGNTVVGRQLITIQQPLIKELSALTLNQSHQETHNKYKIQHSMDKFKFGNLEHLYHSPISYSLGQKSISSLCSVNNINFQQRSSTFSENDSSYLSSSESDKDDSDVSDMFEPTPSPSNKQPSQSPAKVQSGIDVNSCVQFLLDLYSEWFYSASPQKSEEARSSMARPLLMECARSLMLISDMFKEKQQFKWMFNSLLMLYESQPPEDDILLQYIVISLCKSGTVLGLEGEMVERLLPIFEAALNSKLISCQMMSLYGALYLLECYPNPDIQPIVDMLTVQLSSSYVSLSTCPSLQNEDYIVILTSLVFHLVEKCNDPEFNSLIVRASISILSSRESSFTPPHVYSCVVHGLERSILTFSLSSSEREAILKCSAEQLQSGKRLKRVVLLCGLMLTCMYCGKMKPPANKLESVNDENKTNDVLESRLLAMERISILIELIKKGVPGISRVLTSFLPTLMNDFIPSQDILNKVIAEFVTTQQPFPDLLAEVLCKVFQILHDRDQSQLVREWVMLSLGNVIQKSPLSTAVWCLTCLFASASTNNYITSLLPVLVGRINRMNTTSDYAIFCKVALNFYTCLLTEELDRRSFQSIFSTRSQSEPYQLLLKCISTVHGNDGLLQ